MPDKPATIFLPPADTVKVWEARGELKPTVRWSEMMHEEHASAFTVAKIAKLDLLRSVRVSLDDVIRNGGTFEGWKKNIMPELQKHGWWGTVADRELTGTDEPIVVNDRRLFNIYRTNVDMSVAAGRWRKFQSQKAERPYLRYKSNHPRKHPRPEHLSWHGLILPIDDPWWQEHFPPNGWGCHCTADQVSDYMLKSEGWHVSAAPPGTGRKAFYPAGAKRPLMVPRGIDPGFSYNPGTAHLRAVADKALRSVAQSAESGLETVATQVLQEIIDDPAFEQFMAIPDAQFPVHILPADRQKAIAAPSPVVSLPAQITRKQKGELPQVSGGHADLEIGDYRNIPAILANPLVVAVQTQNRLIYFGDVGGRIWKLVVRYDGGRDYPAVVSFHKSALRKITPETRRLKVITDRREK